MTPNAAYVLEEVDWFLCMGEHPEHIAATLNRSLASIERLARRNGRTDISNAFSNAISDTRHRKTA